jgi:hypothetical protein
MIRERDKVFYSLSELPLAFFTHYTDNGSYKSVENVPFTIIL